MKRLVPVIVLVLLTGMWSTRSFAQLPERKISFDRDWRFHLGDVPEARQPGYADSAWRTLDLPHDWSIEGTFSKDNPAGFSGGALPGGIGWYRKTFRLPASDKSLHLFVDFDGVYMNSQVWINGHLLGLRPYGYSSFRYELTPYLHFGSEPNVISVRVDNSQQPNSRWYSGSGIYRNVWLVRTSDVHVAHWGTFVQTPSVSHAEAHIAVETQVQNQSDRMQDVLLKTLIADPQGKVVQTMEIRGQIAPDSTASFQQGGELTHPDLWSPSHPVLYSARSEVYVNGRLVDRYTSPFGIRYFHFDPDSGFTLNGQPMKLLGVCDHHDLGCLGAAVNYRALQRQLELLKAMGCNAIRTSHNPPAPELLQLCDRMGFMVMDEAFDCWKKGKNPYDYHLYWDAWHRRDLEDLVRRDRNHPSVLIWSIGNEIPDQWDSAGARIAWELRDIVRSLDTTRPITSAMNDPESPKNFLSHSGAMDLIGHNYAIRTYDDFKKDFPGKPFIGTETTSAFESRGDYQMPSTHVFRWPPNKKDPKSDPLNPDFTCSSYDNCRADWGNTHETAWKAIKDRAFASGMFIWTGFDYLGEPTPYPWPARSSYFGILDLCGFPKDIYYMYQSEWTHTPVLHVLPDWNWKRGDTVDVWAYYNHADQVKLYLNGRYLGSRSKEHGAMHVMWRVPFEPGTLKAVSLYKGKVVLTEDIHTAGAPARLVLVPDRRTLKASGKDLSFVQVRIVDAQGHLVPHADTLIHFEVQGAGTLVGVDNGQPTDHESMKGTQHRAYNGLCLAVVETSRHPGPIRLIAHAEGLPEASVTLTAQP